MPRRRNEEDLEYYKRKIRKIEQRIRRRHRSRRRNDSSEHDRDSPEILPPDTDDELTTERPSQEVIPNEPQMDASTLEQPSPEEALIQNLSPAQPVANVAETIPTEVLLALGDLMPEKPKFGPPMNSDVARIWSAILKNGLQKENKERIMGHSIPENCALLQAPKLNPEITSSVSDNIVNRDKKIEAEQNQLGIGLSILGSALSSLISSDKVDRLKMITMLSDACRVFADLHFIKTKSRKSLVFPMLDKTFIDAVKDVERDEFLYGSNLIEKIKILKSCQRSGQSIKKPTFTLKQGNSSGPPRQQRTSSRYGPGQKKMQSSTTSQPRKFYNHNRYQSATKKPKGTREKPPARP